MPQEAPNPYALPFQGGYPNINPQLKETTIISQTDPKKVLEEFMHIMRGEEEKIDDEGHSKWDKPAGAKPLMNEDGIRYLRVDVFGANQGIVYSNYEDDDARAIVNAIADEVVDKIGDNYIEYGIDKSNLGSITLIVLGILFSSYRRGMGQGERIFVKTIYSENNTQVTRPIEAQQQRKKFLGII